MSRLLAIYHRPSDRSADMASFEAAYATEHLPLVRSAPGLQSLRAWRVGEALGGDTDVFLVAEMDFADRASLDAALASDEMRQAGRVLRRIAPGPVTLLVLDQAPDLLPAQTPS